MSLSLTSLTTMASLSRTRRAQALAEMKASKEMILSEEAMTTLS